MKFTSRIFVIIGLIGLGLLSSCSKEPSLTISDARIIILLTDQEIPVQAHWVRRDIILLPAGGGGQRLTLASFPATAAATDAPSAQMHFLPTSMPPEIAEKFPHLKDFEAFALAETANSDEEIPRGEIADMLRGEIVALTISETGSIIDASYVQIAGVLDDLYTSGPDDADEATDYGATITGSAARFKLWAPTARAVSVKLYDRDYQLVETVPMIWDEATGAWSAQAHASIERSFYRYEMTLYHPQTRVIETLEVTDPYALSLSTNSRYVQIANLSADYAKPQGWEAHAIPTVARPEELIIYETHIGDFSGTDDSLSNPALKGKYSAFLEPESNGVKHLKSLRAAGLNTIHLLPVYDLGSVNEFQDERVSLDDSIAKACALIIQIAFCIETADASQSLRSLLSTYDPHGSKAQAIIEAIDEVDDYNWGYDPFHYSTPEGSYATNAEGVARIVEFRSMVQRLHEMGFRVVMDVVYNHTFKAGLHEKSVLDKIVPGYYHRRDALTGAIERSTCCENTATEHVMMGKLMTDSLLVWARDYKIDGFRFDLMGHQPRDLMLRAREAVRAVDPDTYFYGEGWNFGEVADNQRFRQATQLELADTEIGTFTDRLRDAVRGGSSFVDGNALRKGQGLGNGLHLYPNELYAGADTADDYHLAADQVRVGLAGNLAEFPLTDRAGKAVTGRDVPYGLAPAGYAGDPADTINYVSKHDNQTLWDNNQYRIPHDVPAETRVRMQLMGLSFPIYAQGIPFLHMGSELLRSKSFLRDSFNYGHWFNAVDFSKTTNNYDMGLPPEAKDGKSWALIDKLLVANEGRDKAAAEDIAFASDVFADMIAIRSGSPLFSLATSDDIKARIRFHNAGPEMQDGLIVMSIDDGARDSTLADLDPTAGGILIVFNHSPTDQTFPMDDAAGLRLHERQATGKDDVVKTSRAEAGAVFVPAWTTAVFVRD